MLRCLNFNLSCSYSYKIYRCDCQNCIKYIKGVSLKNKEKNKEYNKKYFKEHEQEIKLKNKKNIHKILFRHINYRCNNPDDIHFKDYGGRGIKNKFKNPDEIKFLYERDKAYLLKQPSIDRIDNDGDYCIENCQFIEMIDNNRKDKLISIIQYDLKMNFIKEWDSINEAARQLKIAPSNICLVCKYKRKTAGKFIWRYKDADYNYFNGY